jgi:DNA-binding response OmpR family regulator
MKLHILLVDDDHEEFDLLLDALKMVEADDGFKCTYAANAEQALIILHSLVPHIILADLNMPGLTGLELLARLKKDTRLSNTGRYLYSSALTDSTRKTALSLGAGCIAKTGDMTELINNLEKIVSGKSYAGTNSPGDYDLASLNISQRSQIAL